MIVEKFPEIASLPLEHKRILLSELCESISPSDEPDAEIVKLLEERWRAHLDDPSGAVTLEEFRKRLGVA